MGWNSSFFHGASGTDTSDATMLAGDIVFPKTGYGAAGTKLTGTLIKNPTVDPFVINPNVVMYPMHVWWLMNDESGASEQSGTFSNLPSDLKYLVARTGSVYTGSLSDIPRSVTAMLFESDISEIEGDLEDLPSGLTHIDMVGGTIITGDLSTLPTGLTFVRIAYCPLISGVYSPNANTNFINFENTNMSAADTDATLIALNANTTVIGEIYTCGNRTSASDSAVTALLTAGWTVDSETLP